MVSVIHMLQAMQAVAAFFTPLSNERAGWTIAEGMKISSILFDDQFSTPLVVHDCC
jgi:hypothetical protein